MGRAAPACNKKTKVHGTTDAESNQDQRRMAISDMTSNGQMSISDDSLQYFSGQTAKISKRGEAQVKIKAVIETAIYVDDLQAAETFYGAVLGLRVMGRETGRHVFFQAREESVLLAFVAETTLKGEVLPSHGARGAGHFALGIASVDFDAWRNRLQANGVSIEQQVEWPKGGKSLYFRDPASNLVELVTPGVWGLPSGW
jgi:catechol 2,3-dioxygenase-like lactoylglutathione lyase family enzyme